MSESTTLPEFMARGMEFFRGQTVPNSTHEALQAQVTQLTADLATRTTLANELTETLRTSADANVTALAEREAANTLLRAENAVLAERIGALETECQNLRAVAKTGARQAAEILSGAGVDPLAASTTISTETGAKTFSSVVADLQKSGKSKAAAISWATAEFPEEYAAYRKSGYGTL